MNIKQYIAAIRINPVDCNRVKSKDGNPRSDIKYLTSRRKSLCNTYRFDKTGSIEHIEIGSLAYDVVAANYESSSVIKAIGNSSKAIFFEDRLISFEIYAPKVDVETLTSKYSTPKAIDKRAIRVCQNRIGNEFRNNVGDLDAIWTNGEISSILRRVISPPHTTCTDGSDLQYYILEHTKKVKVLDDVIDKYSSEVARQTAKDSKF